MPADYLTKKFILNPVEGSTLAPFKPNVCPLWLLDIFI